MSHRDVDFDTRIVNRQNVLSPLLASASLVAGVLPTGSNLGVFDQWGELVIPPSNTGTQINFVQRISGYDYIQIVLQGKAVQVKAYNGDRLVYIATTGASGQALGEYTLTISYVGDITSIRFGYAGTYSVREINVFTLSKYLVESLALTTFQPVTNPGTYLAGRFYVTINPGLSIVIAFTQSLAATQFGVVRLTATPALQVILSDPLHTQTLGPEESYVILVPKVDANSTFLTVANTLTVPVDIVFSTTVLTPDLPSTVWGKTV